MPIMKNIKIRDKFEAIFCNKAAGWEKGSVENGVGYCRRNYLPGLPSFETINSLNNYLKINSTYYVLDH